MKQWISMLAALMVLAVPSQAASRAPHLFRLSFSLQIRKAWTYRVSLHVASPVQGRILRLMFDGAPLASPVAVPGTGDWNRFETVQVPAIALPSGTHTLRVLWRAGRVAVTTVTLQPLTLYGALTGGHTASPHDATDAAAGLNARTLELQWAISEPAPGQFNEAYLTSIVLPEIARLRAAHMNIVIDLGLQYPPQWVTDIAPFQNNFGQVLSGHGGPGPANTIFSDAVRIQAAAYIRHLFLKIGTDFLGVRIGSGAGENGEALYPFAEKANGYWAWGKQARAQCPSLLLNWRPGDPSPHGEAAAFYAWYVRKLIATENWLLSTVRAGDGRHRFGGNLLLLCPGVGVMPWRYQQLIAQNLWYATGDLGIAEAGPQWDKIIAGIRDKRNMVIECTSLGDATSSVTGDSAASLQKNWSSAHWLAYLAGLYGLPLWGENTGGNSDQNMREDFQEMALFGYSGLFWAWENDLYRAGSDEANLEQYQEMIRALPTQ